MAHSLNVETLEAFLLKSGTQQESLLPSLFCISIRGSPCSIPLLLLAVIRMRPTSPCGLLWPILISTPDIFHKHYNPNQTLDVHHQNMRFPYISLDILQPSVSRSNSQRLCQERSEKVGGNIGFDMTSSFQAGNKDPFLGGPLGHRSFLSVVTSGKAPVDKIMLTRSIIQIF